jgi:hypothetical protein
VAAPAVARAVRSGRCLLRARAAAALRCQYCANLYTASYLTKILAVVICGSGSTCVSVLSS